MVYETGCGGLVAAAALERVGGVDGGRVVHLYQTGNPQTQHLAAMNFSPEIMANLSTLNMYHLRSLEQGHDITQMHKKNSEEEAEKKEEAESDHEEGGEEEAPEMKAVPHRYIPVLELSKNDSCYV